MRRLSMVVLLGLLVLPTTVLAAGEPRCRLTPRVQYRAQSVVVRQSDLVAGYRVDRDRRARIPMPRCPGFSPDRSDLTITGDAASFFTDGSGGIASYATLFRTSGDQEKWWRRGVGLRYARCLARVPAAKEMPRGIRTTVVSVQARPVKRMADAAAQFRLVLRHTRAGRSVDVYRNIALLADDRWSVVVVSYAPLRPCECAEGLVGE